jgi:Ca2+-transporting ATPase
MDANAAVSALESDAAAGLTSADARQRLDKYGPNELADKQRVRPLVILFKQFANAMTYLLLVAAGISFFLREWPDGIAILVVILINSLIGFGMEYRAALSMTALQKMVSVFSTVLRDGSVRQVRSEQLVPGDIIEVEAGDMITADARILEAVRLEANESTLTGESLPVIKHAAELEERTVLADRVNMLYRGTFATRGRGRALVVSTGMETELGHIARMVQSTQRERTPLEKKLQVFSTKLILITVILVVVIFLAGLINKAHWLEILQTAIALAVAAIPEGLPIVATLALANGMIRMAQKNVIVKKLAAVETLGSTDTICTDKTGTLTRNRIEVEVLEFPGEAATVFSTKGPHTDWIQFQAGEPQDALGGSDNGSRLLKIGVLCNTAEYSEDNGEEHAVGDPLEVGLLRFVSRHGMDIKALRQTCPRESEIPFDSEIKLMATQHLYEGRHIVAVKGAAEAIIDRCSFVRSGEIDVPMTTAEKDQWLDRADRLALRGLRVLAFAWKQSEEAVDEAAMLDDLNFAGIVGFMDTPAPGVMEAISTCKKAGIKVVMITGDHPSTALTIAHELGMVDESDHKVMVGAEMKAHEELSEAERKAWLETRIFARVNPSQKLGLISVFQDSGSIVGMTGDGVNDAPALTKSNIGIAMGIRGTQVAQQAADMILKDDAFSSIVSAVKQGRVIFDNIRKFVIYLLSCNLSELLIVSVIAVLNFPFQLLPLQILFINLVTDVLPAISLGMSSGSPDVMLRRPRRTDEAIITRRHWTSIWIYSAVICLFTIAAVLIRRFAVPGSGHLDPVLLNNIVFFSLIMAQLLHVFNMAERRSGIFNNEIVRNSFLWFALASCAVVIFLAFIIQPVRSVLQIGYLEWIDWLIISGCSLMSMVVNRLLKILNVTG